MPIIFIPATNRYHVIPQRIASLPTSENQQSTLAYIKQTVYELLTAIKEVVLKIKHKILGIQEALLVDDPVSKKEITVVEDSAPSELSYAQKKRIDEVKTLSTNILQTIQNRMSTTLTYKPSERNSTPPTVDINIIADLMEQIPLLAPYKHYTLCLENDIDYSIQIQRILAKIFPTNDPVINLYCITLYQSLEAQICCQHVTRSQQESINIINHTKKLEILIKDLEQQFTDIFSTKSHALDIITIIEDHTNEIKQLTQMKAELEQKQHEISLLYDNIELYRTSIRLLISRTDMPLQHLLPTVEADLGHQLMQQAPTLIQRIKKRTRAWYEPNPRLAYCVQRCEKVSDLFFAMYRMRNIPKENLHDQLQKEMNQLMKQAMNDARTDKLFPRELLFTPGADDIVWEHGLNELHIMYTHHTTILHKEIEQLMQSAHVNEDIIKTVLNELPSNTFPFTRDDFTTLPNAVRSNLFQGLDRTKEELYEKASTNAKKHCPALIEYTLQHFETAPLSAWQEKTFQEKLTDSCIGILSEWHQHHIDDNGQLDAINQKYLAEILYGIEEDDPCPYTRYTHKLLETKSVCTQLAQIQVHINTCEQNIKESETKLAELKNNILETGENHTQGQILDNALHLHIMQTQLHSLYEAREQYEIRKKVHKAALNHIKETGIRDSISREHNAIHDVLGDDQHKELAKAFTNEPISPNIMPLTHK